MLIFSTSRGKTNAWLFILRKAKWIRWGETAIRFGMSMPHQTILMFALFLPSQHIFLPISVSQMLRASPRLTGRAMFLVVFSPGADQYGRFMDCLRRVLRKIRVCFLHLEFAPVIWARILHGRGCAVLLRREAQSAHRWSQFAYGQCGVWGQ